MLCAFKHKCYKSFFFKPFFWKNFDVIYISKYKFWDCIFPCRQRLGYRVSIDFDVVFQDFWFGDAGGQDEATAGSAPETPQGRIRQERQTRGKSAIVYFSFTL